MFCTRYNEAVQMYAADDPVLPVREMEVYEMKNRLFALLMMLALLLGVLSGCGSAPAFSAPEPSQTEAAPEASAAPEVPETPEASEAPQPSLEEESLQEPEEPVYTVTYPLTDTPIELSLLHAQPMLGPLTGRAGVDSYGDVAGIQKAGEATGVNIVWNEMNMMTASEEFNLVVVSGDYPDMLSSVTNYYAGGQPKAFEDEVIVDLSEYVPQYAPDYFAAIKDDGELYRQTLDDEGRTLGIYAIYDEAINNEGAMVRKDWLDELGLEVPTTFEALTETMTAIQREKGVANPIYINESANFLAYGFQVMGFDMAQSTIPIYHDGDTVHCSLIEDDYRSYITQLHDWYETGLINPNFMEFSSDLMSGEIEVEMNADRIAIWSGMVTNMTNYYASAPDESFEVVPTIVTVDGENDHITLATRSQDAICVTTACDEIEAALGWINYWFQDEGIMLYNYGVEGDTYVMENGTPAYTDKVMNNELGVDPTLFCRTFSLAGCSFGYTVQERIYLLYEDYQTAAQEYWTAHSDGTMGVPTLTLLTEESSVLATYGTDIVTYVSEMLPKFIMGDLPLDSWDDYVATLKEMHIDEIVEIYQAAYTRYLNR